jgi:peptide/nickel transport system permease protein
MSRILALVARRLIVLVPILLGITLLTFIFIHAAPSNPALSVLGTHASSAQVKAFERANGLNKPLAVQYLNFLGQLLHGNLGTTLVTGQPVASVIGNAFPVTIHLTIFAMVMALVIGLVLGAAAAYWGNSFLDLVIRLFSVTWVAAPPFWLALLAIEFFAIRLGWLPSGGFVPLTQSPGQWLSSMILPASSLALPVGGMIARVVRAAVISELNEDYVRSARGLGLSELRIMASYVSRNALAAPINVIGMQVGFLLSGAVLTETIFSLPGVGQLLINSVQQGDLATVQGIVIVGASLFVLANLAVDVITAMIDPRIEVQT